MSRPQACPATSSERDKHAEEKFYALAAQWHNECMLSSSVTDICTNMAYQQIHCHGNRGRFRSYFTN